MATATIIIEGREAGKERDRRGIAPPEDDQRHGFTAWHPGGPTEYLGPDTRSNAMDASERNTSGPARPWVTPARSNAEIIKARRRYRRPLAPRGPSANHRQPADHDSGQGAQPGDQRPVDRRIGGTKGGEGDGGGATLQYEICLAGRSSFGKSDNRTRGATTGYSNGNSRVGRIQPPTSDLRNMHRVHLLQRCHQNRRTLRSAK